MSDSRAEILARVRGSLKRTQVQGGDPGERLRRHDRNLIPERTRETANAVALFQTMLEGVAGTLERVANAAAVPRAVAGYLARHNLGGDVAMSPDAKLGGIPWRKAPLLSIRSGAARETDAVSITGAFAAIAETGTLLMASFAGHPNTLNFLPDHHIVVLHRSELVATYEEAWDRLRERGALPRTCAFITGPSRTSDIELVPTLGAHGPRRLHVVLIDE